MSRLRIFAGYAGWGAGQLEDELAEGAWYVVDARFGGLHRRRGGDAFSEQPEDAVARGAAPAGRRPRDGVDLPRRPVAELSAARATPVAAS